jgi:hypothetical protein
MTTTDPTPTTPATGRIEILRTALREVVAACGGLATAEVTDEFLCLAPGEVRAQLAKARRATPLAATREAPPLAQQGAEITREQAVALYTEVMAAHNCQTLGEMAEHFARAVWARAQGARPAIQPVAVSKPVARLMYWNEKGGPALRITRVARTYEEMPEGQNSYWDEGEPLYLAADQQEGRDDA